MAVGRFFLALVTLFCQHIGAENDTKSSLTFIIDDTGSMQDEITQVKDGANAIFDTVLHSDASQIENFILVTFNDNNDFARPDVKLRTVTTNRETFKDALANIMVYGGGDCPEMAFSGIELALEKSFPRSYLYVFTDASAKDHMKIEKIKSMSVKNQAQVVFVLTGICNNKSSRDYLVYHELAKATSGQVFHLEKGEVKEILEYVSETVNSRKTVLATKEFPPGYDHRFNYTVDEHMKGVAISISGEQPKIDIEGPGGTKPDTKVIVKTHDVEVLKMPNTLPGVYTAGVGSKTNTSVVVTAETDIDFKHGFSISLPSSLNDTTTRPVPDEESHLLIKLVGKDINKVDLSSIELLDIAENVIAEKPLSRLEKDKNNLYITKLFSPPDKTFKIAVNGFDKKTKTPIRRISSTTIEKQKPLLETITNKSPVVTVYNHSVTVDFGKTLLLKCKVYGYPKPKVIWTEVDFGLELKSQMKAVELPYEYLSILEISKVNKNATYRCKALNLLGEDEKIVKVNLETYFKISEPPKESPKIDKTINIIHVKKGSSTDISCRILQGMPSPSITWLFKSKDVKILKRMKHFSENLHIKSADLNDSGFYRCIAQNIAGTDFHDVILIVEYPPIIKKNIIDKLVVKAGESTKLHCNVQGMPVPTVKWLLNGTLLTRTKKPHVYNDYSLSFVATVEDNGHYSCEAENSLGTAKYTVEVTVYVPVSITPPESSIFKMMEGHNLTLPCKSNGYPKPVTLWRFFSYDSKIPVKFLITSDINYLMLKNVQFNQEGFYTCTASNGFTSTNITYEVEVYAPPKIINTSNKIFKAVDGDRLLRVPCTVSGNPKPTVIWMKGVYNLAAGSEWYDIEEDGTLIIKDIDEFSAGAYVCRAENKFGFDNATYYVIVNAYPEDGQHISPILLKEGTSEVNVTCDISHNTLDIVRWYKNRRHILTGSLVLRDVTRSDAGIYTCRVNSDSISGTRHVQINVGSQPIFLTEQDEDISYETGKNVIFDCTSKGEPDPKVTWLHEGKKIKFTGMKYNFNMKLNNRGLYICRVSNDYGTITRNFYIKSKDCLLNIEKDFQNHQPLLTTVYFTWPNFDIVDGYIQIPEGNRFLLSCPKQFKEFNETQLTISCYEDKLFKVDDKLLNFHYLQCKEEVKPVTRRTGMSCANGNSEFIQVGYQANEAFLSVYETCINIDQRVPLYAKHNVKPKLANRRILSAQIYTKDKILPFHFDSLYDCALQINTISSVLGKWFHYEDQCCFSKKQLVSPNDVLPGLSQVTTFTYLNVLPFWSTCNTNIQNWDTVGAQIRFLSTSTNHELQVWTGSAQQLQLRDVSGIPQDIFIIDKLSRQQPVPKYFWKVVQNPTTKSSLAIIQLNIPDLSQSEAFSHVLCKDICKETDWMSFPEWQDVKKGFTYCCALDDFEHSFGYVGRFGNNYKILNIY